VDVDNGSGLDPLRELVDYHEKVGEAPGRLSEWPHLCRGARRRRAT
jgi:hypothetical protein